MNRQAEAQVNHFPNINFVRAFSLGALFITFIVLQTLSSFARPESLAPLA